MGRSALIRLLDRIVLDWGIYSWTHGGERVEQVQVLLSNGMLLVMDFTDFMMLADDDSWG